MSLVEELCPRVEVLWPGACAIGARGPARYFGGEEALAGKIIEAVTGGGFACQAGIADGLFAAQLAARARRRPVTVVPPGQAREFLAPYPVGVLDSAELAELLPRLDSEGMTELLPRLGIVDAGGLRPAARQPGGEPVRGGGRHRAPAGARPGPPPAGGPPALGRPVGQRRVRPARPAGRARGVRRQGPRRADARRPRRPRPCLRARAGAGDQRRRAGDTRGCGGTTGCCPPWRWPSASAGNWPAGSQAGPGRRPDGPPARRGPARRDRPAPADPRSARPRPRPPARPVGRRGRQRPGRPCRPAGAGHARPRRGDAARGWPAAGARTSR